MSDRNVNKKNIIIGNTEISLDPKNYKQHMSYNKCWNCPHCKYDYFAKGGLLLKCPIYDDMIEVSECPIVSGRLYATIQQGNYTFKKLAGALRKVL